MSTELNPYAALRVPDPRGAGARNAQRMADALAATAVRVVASVPDSRITQLLDVVADDDRFVHVPLSSEDDGVGVCAGAWFGGVGSCLVMQNAGFLKAVNDVVGLAQFSQVPLLMLISYRGDMGEPHWYHGLNGRTTEKVLEALGVKYAVLDDIEEVETTFARARLSAETGAQPVAVLLTLRAGGYLR